jgi:hypothetical protein
MRPWILLFLLAAACGDSSGPTLPATAASIEALAGMDQIGPAGQALTDSLAVIIRDTNGRPMPGVTVTWSIVTGDGHITPASSMTGADGIARSRRTLGPNAGTQTVAAHVAALAPVTFSAVAQIQGAVVIGNRSIGPLTDTVFGTLTEIEQPLVVLVLDQRGVPVPGVRVTWSASGGGSVAPISPVTNAGGESIAEYTFGAIAGPGYGAIASVEGLIGSPITFELSALAATPVSIEKTNGDGLVVQPGAKVVHTITARDAYGNPTRGVAIQWAVAEGGGSIAPPQNFTDRTGTAEATHTLGGVSGRHTVTATAASLPKAPVLTFSANASTVR